MKEALIGYVTAVINRRNRDIDNLNAIHAGGAEIKKHKSFIDELNDLLTFIEETKEGAADERFNKYIRELEDENEDLKARIKVLEESCQFSNEVILTQFRKICEFREKLEEVK